MKLGENIDTPYMILDSTTISNTLQKLFGDSPDDWMITNQMAVTKDGIQYSKVQVDLKGKSKIIWFRYPKGPSWNTPTGGL